MKWTLIFFVISIVAGVFGFAGIAAGAATIAKWLALAVDALFFILGVLAGEAAF
ncbi:MAG: DUF1328 family protein [Pseudorhodoplanes sp.]|uniref:DUF1328 family protein n=1 Tax=Pseudorhodoplanes sp. TaxID=1934341 RepID=UPI003D1067A8